MRSYQVAERVRVRRNTALFGPIDGVFEGEVTPRNDQDETLVEHLTVGRRRALSPASSDETVGTK